MISGWHPSRCPDAPKERPAAKGWDSHRRTRAKRPAAEGWDSHIELAGYGEEDVDSIQSQSPEHSSRGMTKLVASAPWAVRPAAKS